MLCQPESPGKAPLQLNMFRTNCFVKFDFKTAIFKRDISDHFPIRFFLPMTNEFSKTEPIQIQKRIINNKTEIYCQHLHETDCTEIKALRN